jgi:hypothetical protein
MVDILYLNGPITTIANVKSGRAAKDSLGFLPSCAQVWVLPHPDGEEAILMPALDDTRILAYDVAKGD